MTKTETKSDGGTLILGEICRGYMEMAGGTLSNGTEANG